MDTMGDGAEIYDDEDLPPDRPSVFTPEAQAITAAGLVLAGMLAQGLFQFLSYFVAGPNGSFGPVAQYLIYAGPSGLLAAAGAGLGWRARHLTAGTGWQGLAVGSAVVGAVMTAAVVAGIVTAAAIGEDTF